MQKMENFFKAIDEIEEANIIQILVITHITTRFLEISLNQGIIFSRLHMWFTFRI